MQKETLFLFVVVVVAVITVVGCFFFFFSFCFFFCQGLFKLTVLFCACVSLCEYVARLLQCMHNSVNLDIVSLNVRRIRDLTKRRSIFSFLKDLKANIYFLQETYSAPNDKNIWKYEWGGEIFFSHGTPW